jgi:hypothetical protein
MLPLADLASGRGVSALASTGTSPETCEPVPDSDGFVPSLPREAHVTCREEVFNSPPVRHPNDRVMRGWPICPLPKGH